MKGKLICTICILPILTGSAFALKAVGYVPYKTIGVNNLPVLDGHIFTNEYNPSIASKLSPQTFTQILSEAEILGCKGGDSLSKNKTQSVLSCFQRNNGEDKESTAIYEQVKSSITSITLSGGHFCMASHTGKGKWITAAHCFLGIKEPYSDYKILLDKPYAIKVTTCSISNCDIALVEAIDGSPPERSPTPLNSDLNSISNKTPLFIPGIEVGTLIPGNNIQGVAQVVMWSKIKDACIPYEIKRGCITYTCSTLLGFSGAPVYSVEANNPKLIGVHSGVELGSSCTDYTVNIAVTSDIFAGMLK